MKYKNGVQLYVHRILMKSLNLERALLILEILQERTDASHIISMTELLSELSENGIETDRRTVYMVVELLQEYGYKICYTRKGKQGYYMEPAFTSAEALVFIDAIKNNQSISQTESEALISKIETELYNEVAILPETGNINREKTDNKRVLQNIEVILKAVHHANHIYFYYYDLTIRKRRKYRHQKKEYCVVPYAIVNQNGRYYCIGYQEEADKFLIYRIDKMDEVRKDEEIVRKKNFDLDSFLQSSFHMFKGDPQTITCRFSSDMSNAVMDQFGTNYILKEANEDYFTISIRTAITPTLISWIMQYGDKVKVLGPDELIDKLVSTAKGVINQYE